LSVHPLIRPFTFQSVIVPILAERMNNILEAPVPFVAGCVSQPAEVPSDIVILDVIKDQFLTKDDVPPLPRMQELYPFHFYSSLLLLR
jgi:hypothetical protein